MAHYVIQRQDLEQTLRSAFDEVERKIGINHDRLNSIECELFDDYNYDNIRNKVKDLRARVEGIEGFCSQVYSRGLKGAKITITKGKNTVKVRV